MSYSIVSFDLDAQFRHFETVRPNWPPSRDPFVESARARARAMFEAFAASPEASALEDEPQWPIVVMREAALHHGMSIDTMTPEAFQAVSEFFVTSDTCAAYAHWCEVVQGELEAFFRFLAGEGFEHAEGCLAVLARLEPVRKRRFERLVDATITPISEEQARRFAMAPSCSAPSPCMRVNRD